MIREEVLRHGPTGGPMGILTLPPAGGTAHPTVLFINAGLIHHVGPARLHVLAARELAHLGVASLRLDLSGLGDSPAREDHLPIFELVRQEPSEAMDALAERGLGPFVLAGICAGAYSAFHVACDDPRVVGAAVINPEDLALGTAQPETATDEARVWARRYWTRSVFRPAAWVNLLRGRVDYRRLMSTLLYQMQGRTSANDPTPQTEGLRRRMRDAVASRSLQLWFISSGTDVSRDSLALLLDQDTLASVPPGRLLHTVLEDCDHLFQRAADQRRLIALLSRLVLATDAGASALLENDVVEIGNASIER